MEQDALHVQGLPMVDRNNPVSAIRGELYMVDGAIFADLDLLEGHTHCYCRYLTRVALADGTTEAAWMYSFAQPDGPIIESGRYQRILAAYEA